MEKNLYDTLGIDKNASPEEIKSAYRKKAMENHPDKVGENDQIRDITLAYEILSDGKKREKYDRTGETQEKPFDKQFELYVYQMFIGIIDACPDVERFDLVDKFKELTRESIGNALKSIKDAEKRARKLEKVMSRLTAKGTMNYLGKIVENNLNGCYNEINGLKDQVEFYEKAIVALDDYEYRFEGTEEYLERFIKENPGLFV